MGSCAAGPGNVAHTDDTRGETGGAERTRSNGVGLRGAGAAMTAFALCLALAAGLDGQGAPAAQPAWASGDGATPNCPGQALDSSPDAGSHCTTVMIHGNTYYDANENGQYDPNHGPERRLAGLTVRLVDPTSGAVVGQAVTNADGYYRFSGLVIGPGYRVELALPAGYRATSAVSKLLDSRDFSRYWCCSSRVDFGMIPGAAPASTVTAPPPPVVVPSGTPPPPPCCDVPYGRQVHLPILNYEANGDVCSSVVEAQNVGAWPSKALLVLWGAPGSCPPQCTGPLGVQCSGLLAPGSAWDFMGDQVPRAAKGGVVFSAPAIQVPGAAAGNADVFADLLCEALFRGVVGNCEEYRRFKKAFDELLTWQTGGYTFDFGAYPGAPMAVEVLRKCPGDSDPMVSVTALYSGLADEMLGTYDPVYGGYAFFAPLVYAAHQGLSSWLYIQNAGMECSSVEVWFRAQGDCLRPMVCDVATLAPGETHQLDAASCVAPGWLGSAWVRGSQPLAVAVDTVGRDLLSTYTGNPSELRYTFQGAPLFGPGSPVAYGPLLYSEYQGWDSQVQVQNLSLTLDAKVKVYFLDSGGDVIAALTDWICPGGSQAYYLPVLWALPGNWVGAVRVESQDWIAPGHAEVQAPNVAAVAELVKYADVGRTQPLESVAYAFLSEQRAFDWQDGAGPGGLASGVGRIGIPSLMRDVDGTGLSTELAVANVVPQPGFTDFAIYIYDQNGLVQSLCEKLHEKQVEYLDVARDLAFLPRGFKGSAVISAVFWQHQVYDREGRPERNVVGLAAVKVERTDTLLGSDVPGDESSASEGFPILGRFDFAAPDAGCPGVPGGGAAP